MLKLSLHPAASNAQRRLRALVADVVFACSASRTSYEALNFVIGPI